MHIFSAADEKFVPHFCAMLHSAWLFHPDARYTLIAFDVAEPTLEKLRQFAAKRHIALDIFHSDKRVFHGLPVNDVLPAATYGRLLLPELLPETVERGLYLDADITLNGSLDGLLSTDMKGMPLAAVPERDWIFQVERDLPDGFKYHNTGVLLFDLGLWRRENIASQILDFARTTQRALPYHDQSATNIVLQGRILSLERTFNAFSREDFEEVPDPVVIHYAGSKPWVFWWMAFYELYRFHREQTPWPMPKVGPGRLTQIRRIVAARLGLQRYREIAQTISLHRRLRESTGEPALKRARELLGRANAQVSPQAITIDHQGMA